MGKNISFDYFLMMLFLFVGFACVNSQTNSIGFMSGSSITNVQSKMFLDGTAFNYGYIGGVEISRESSNKIFVQAGILYEHKGFKKLVLTTDANGGVLFSYKKSSFNYNYFSLPVSIGYRYGGVFFGEIFVGVSFSGLFNSNEKLVLGSEVKKSNHTHYASRYDISPIIGIGQGYHFENDITIIFRAEFQHGLINVANANYYSGSEIRQKGFYLQLSLRKNINLRKKEAENHQKE